MPIRCCPERKTCEMKAEKTFNPVQHTKILENILKGWSNWSSLTQGKLRISQSIFQHFKRQSKHKHQARGAAQAVRPPAYSERNHFAQDRREKPGRGDGRPNLKLSGSREEDRQGEAAFTLSQGDEEISSLRPRKHYESRPPSGGRFN